MLANVYLNGTYDDVFEVIKLTTVVIASDLIYFIILSCMKQDTYTVDFSEGDYFEVKFSDQSVFLDENEILWKEI